MTDIRRRGKISTGPGGPPKDAVLIEVLKADEKWSTYELDDGSIIKTRPAVIEVWRVENEYDEEGNPAYLFKAQGIMNVHAPQNLRKGNK